MQAECDSIASHLPLRQGDIFAWHPLTRRDAFDRVGLVLTADCDFAHGKAGDLVSYVPVMSLRAYILLVWAKKKLDARFARVVADAGQFVHKARVAKSPESVRLTDAALLRLLEEQPPERVANKIGIKDQKERNKLCKTHFALVHACLRAFRDNGDPAVYFQGLCELGRLQGRITPEQIAKQAAEELTKTPPQDVFLLSSIPHLKEDEGWVVMLRYLRAIPMQGIVFSMAEARDRPECAVRVARVAPVLKFAITQQFGALFSRIGIPAELENSQQEILALVCDDIAKVSGGRT